MSSSGTPKMTSVIILTLCFLICLTLASFFADSIREILISAKESAAIAANAFVLLSGLLMAVLFALGWKIGGELRRYLTGKTDVIEDEVRTFNCREWRNAGIGIMCILLLLSGGALIGQDESVTKYGINPLLLPLGFSAYFPLLILKAKMIEKIKRSIR